LLGRAILLQCGRLIGSRGKAHSGKIVADAAATAHQCDLIELVALSAVPRLLTTAEAPACDGVVGPTAGDALAAGDLGLSRKYSEMRLENLSAAGRAVRDCLG
jgi:hypothetical protein